MKTKPTCLDENVLGRRCKEMCIVCLGNYGEGFSKEDLYELKEESKHEEDE